MRYSISSTVLALLATVAATAQMPSQPSWRDVSLMIDSGYVVNDGKERDVVFSEVVHVPASTYVRVLFEHASLGAAPKDGDETILRITSLLDGGVQHHTNETLRQWRFTTAYFNGPTVLVEIIADPGAGTSRLRATRGVAGNLIPADELTICDGVDDRLPSDDPRVGRGLPIECTAWIIDDARRCLLGAGHCSFFGGYSTMEFNVPLSDSNGMIQHPGPEDQYAVDAASLQNQSQGQGDDWAYFGCFPNTETGLTPGEAQGFFVLADAPPAFDPDHDIRITGYGTTSAPIPPEWNAAQKTLVGPYAAVVPGSTVQYRTDTTGGNSGSPVIHEQTGMAIGVHTHGGCGNGTGSNLGTAIDHPQLQSALTNPTGVCVPPPMDWTWPDGRPDAIDPAGDTIRVIVSGGAADGPIPGSGLLHYQPEGAPAPITIPMVEVEPNVYDATFPALECDTPVRYFVSAVNGFGEVREFNPAGPPANAWTTLAAYGVDAVFEDDMERDTGWTTSGDATSGQWERGVPAGNGVLGDPTMDGDASGQCFATGLAQGDDVGGGVAHLTSPALDATQGDAWVHWYQWFSNDAGGQQSDWMLVEISNDDGDTWTTIEQVGPFGDDTMGGWKHRQHRVADFVTPTDQVRVRFSPRDNGPETIVEAAIDGFKLLTSENGAICTACEGDLSGDGLVGTNDLLIILAAWGVDDGGDVDGDGMTNVDDLVIVLANWGPC